MAPATRAAVKKQPPARKQRPSRQTSSQEPSWQIEPRQDLDTHPDDQHAGEMQQAVLDQPSLDLERRDFDVNNFDEDYVLESRESPQLAVTLNPLRDMAHQVGREAEIFAEKLDQFLSSDPTQNKFGAVLGLVKEFKDLAEDTVKSLQKNHQRDAALQLRKEWNEREKLSLPGSALISSSTTSSGPLMTEEKAQQVRKLRQWQQEADIWELFRIMLELHHNPNQRAVQQQKEETLRSLGRVHRYTSEEDLFTRFVLQDDLARERLMVKKWLEQTADHQEGDVSGIIQELEAKTARGRGLWQNGWMHTREKIKGEKRTRSWSNTPGVPLPHVKRRDNTQLLVTTLDPDAAARQDRALEKDDEYFERAMWITCWSMLRRGKSWEEVSDWCQSKHEGWRALSVGAAMNPADCLTKADWRHMCYLASQADSFGDYEAAVYGLLGGSHGAVQKVSRSVDDKLYGYYNAALLRQFDQYLAVAFPDRSSPARHGFGEDAVKDPQQQIVELIERLRKQPETSAESIQPMKIIQSYLLADDLGSMIHTMGYAISYTATLQNTAEDLIMRLKPFWPGNDNQPESEVVLDHQSLRIAMHIGIVLAELRNERLVGEERDAEENVIVAYIQSLRAAHNRDAIPLYASRLTKGRRIITMARALEDVETPSEQGVILSLMDKYGMDSITILNEQLFYLLSTHVGPRLDHINPLSMLEKTDNSLYPGQCIKLGLLPEVSNAHDDAIIRGLQWYNIIEGHWQATFRNMNLALRKCLMGGRIACALRIVDEFPYDALSRRKSYSMLGRSINFMTFDEEPPHDQVGIYADMRAQSRTYYDLTQIVEAIKALVEYRDVERQYTGKALKLSSAPLGLKEAKEHVDDAMSTVLHNNILGHPADDDEITDLRYLRTNYIPELIIAYNTVLHSAGAVISRDNLIQSMDLSVTIANQENISECFTKAGRMGELVKSFAETSKKMLILKAEGKPYKPRKEPEGKELGIWEIGPQNGHGNHHEISL